MNPIRIGISPCPNDTFIFDALINERLPDCPFDFQFYFEDVETLNQLAIQGELDVVKISFGNLLHVEGDYHLLRSGGALGYGCGPLLLRGAEPYFNPDLPVVLPGRHTTARVLFQFWLNRTGQTVASEEFLQFDHLYEMLKQYPATQGVVIHESRFTYERDMLQLVQDLGEFWEQETNCPIPLGGIVAKRALGFNMLEELDHWIRASLEFAWDHPHASRDFIKELAQIPDDHIIESHIDTYVNDFSLGDSLEGEEAIAVFRGVLQELDLGDFEPPQGL